MFTPGNLVFTAWIRDGTVIHSTANFDEEQKAALLKSGPIRVAAIDEAFTHLVTVGDDKRLKLWRIDGLKVLSERCASVSCLLYTMTLVYLTIYIRELPKKATSAQFTKDGQTILVSDKFGDIFGSVRHPSVRLSLIA